MKNESLEEWVESVRVLEYNNARSQLSKGYPIEQVLDTMSTKIINKLLHPLYKNIKVNCSSNFDLELNKKEYYNNYLNNRKLVADHIDDQLFDNTK